MEAVNDHDDAAILAAALALIDEAYSTASFSVPRPRRTLDDRVWLLREQVAELERVVAIHTYGASRWGHVAASQRLQEEQASCENTLLKEGVKTQQSLAQQVCAMLETLRSLSHPLKTTTAGLSSTPGASEASVSTALLTSRLNHAAAIASRKWLGLLPTVGPEFRERGSQFNHAGNMLIFQSQYASYLPFKLSLVASELWALMLDDAIGTETLSTTPDQLPNTATGAISLRLALSPSTNLQADGCSALRRVFTADGTVVLATTSITAGPVISTTEKMAEMDGYEMHEVEWLRLGRVASAPSLVYIESITSIEIKPVGSVDSDRCDSEANLPRVGDALLRECERIGGRKIQRLENRLLDASVASRTRPPTSNHRVH